MGRELLSFAETWAKQKGYGRLTLNVFDGNRRARSLYEHVGFVVETVRYIKLL